MKPSADHNPEAVERITNAIAFKRRLIDAAGGALTAEKVRALLGHKTIQAVYKAVKDRRLLMIEDNGTKLFPVFSSTATQSSQESRRFSMPLRKRPAGPFCSSSSVVMKVLME